MLNDVTFGQFYPAKSVVHRLDPRIKLLSLIAIIVLLFVAGIMISLAIEEMLPEANNYNKKKQSLLGLIIGLILVIINVLLF